MIVKIEHVIATGGCGVGMKNYMLSRGFSKNEVRNFFKNGMLISEFDKHFSDDPRCKSVIERALADGKKEKTDGRL